MRPHLHSLITLTSRYTRVIQMQGTFIRNEALSFLLLLGLLIHHYYINMPLLHGIFPFLFNKYVHSTGTLFSVFVDTAAILLLCSAVAQHFCGSRLKIWRIIIRSTSALLLYIPSICGKSYLCGFGQFSSNPEEFCGTVHCSENTVCSRAQKIS